jgi:hypothetical protein
MEEVAAIGAGNIGAIIGKQTNKTNKRKDKKMLNFPKKKDSKMLLLETR